ncbi:Glyoxalase/Bleomycin resistance protein/Dihydroxybiphenyl dioxygenase [Patellaria atrata CBS 101060]|uniref:Glyoxalase/Bleomycin resistance protein/Dihydroxybiphenyl dioxygenase n=1 Tax=Patellaria atrata CBS 101060 TaxID=1346257 RepID=A0A9P4S7A1_9PEZI|nr:Glyoxalase/Bleomycin resistance protein/Dihydroxybiphenyl dioxygenase [Patellaria atrata CBS 101060]
MVPVRPPSPRHTSTQTHTKQNTKHPHQNQNYVLNHIALSVPDLEAACTWYTTLFGFRRIRSDRHTIRSTSPSAPIFKIYGDRLREVKVAWLSTGNSVGLEIFQFVDPGFKAPEREFEFERGGFYHVGVTVPDVEGMVRRCEGMGARRIGEVIEVGDGEQAAYLRDPWGNTVEVLSCSYEQLMANRALLFTLVDLMGGLGEELRGFYGDGLYSTVQYSTGMRNSVQKDDKTPACIVDVPSVPRFDPVSSCHGADPCAWFITHTCTLPLRVLQDIGLITAVDNTPLHVFLALTYRRYFNAARRFRTQVKWDEDRVMVSDTVISSLVAEIVGISPDPRLKRRVSTIRGPMPYQCEFCNCQFDSTRYFGTK